MKKKTAKKLVLAKETLRNLEATDLKKVAGGVTVVSGCTACDPSVGSCCSCINSCAENMDGG